MSNYFTYISGIIAILSFIIQIRDVFPAHREIRKAVLYISFGIFIGSLLGALNSINITIAKSYGLIQITLIITLLFLVVVLSILTFIAIRIDDAPKRHEIWVAVIIGLIVCACIVIALGISTDKRGLLITLKISFVLGLLGMGTLKFGNPKLPSLVYVIPFVSFLFDLYILGENFGVKRIGYYFRNKCTESPKVEKNWEAFVLNNRDKFTKCAASYASSIILVICTAYIFFILDIKTIILFKILWFFICVGLIIRTFRYERNLESNFSD